jgi:ABC-type amino acid transport system permease subunit
MSYTVVLFVHNTVKEHHMVLANEVVKKFIELSSQYVKVRADLDIYDSFISYSDDETMVQLIGNITNPLRVDVIKFVTKIRLNYELEV